MGSLEDRARMREQIAIMEFADRKRREDEITAPDEEADPQQDPSLPPQLPRPEYTTSPGVIGRDDAEVDFYVSCQAGRLDEAKEYVESLQPPNMVCQYGLEQASFADHPAVVRYLLESGAAIHGNVLPHSHNIEKNEFSKREYVNTKSIFKGLEGSQDITALLKVFLDAGWHPNQPWYYPLSKGTCRVIKYINGNKLVVKYLVERLPDLRFAPGHGRFIGAIRTLDTELLDLLSHGANATVERPYSSLWSGNARKWKGTRECRSEAQGRRSPSPSAHATAEWLLQHGVRFNNVNKMLSRDMTWPSRMWEDERLHRWPVAPRTGTLQSGFSRMAQTMSYSEGVP